LTPKAFPEHANKLGFDGHGLPKVEYEGESSWTPEKYAIAQTLAFLTAKDESGNPLPIDKDTYTFLVGAEFAKNGSDLTPSGRFPNANWNPDNRQVNWNATNADNQNGGLAARSRVRLYALLVDLSQPPSCLPASASLAWAWNILVSLASLSSKISRSLSRAASSWLLARNK